MQSSITNVPQVRSNHLKGWKATAIIFILISLILAGILIYVCMNYSLVLK